jgi:hypothetical protein
MTGHTAKRGPSQPLLANGGLASDRPERVKRINSSLEGVQRFLLFPTIPQHFGLLALAFVNPYLYRISKPNTHPCDSRNAKCVENRGVGRD